MPVTFLRSDPKDGFSIIGVDTITLYFNNKPTDVKITEAADEVQQAIVKGNTVEVSVKQPFVRLQLAFTVRWKGGTERLLYNTDQDDAVADFKWASPASGSSIVGVETIKVHVAGVANNFKCYSHASESFIDVDRFITDFEFDVPHPIKAPSISFTLSWTSRDATAKNSVKLTYINEDAVP